VKAAHPGAATPFFGTAGKPIPQYTLSAGLVRDQVHEGGARNRQMVARIAPTMEPVAATSAS